MRPPMTREEMRLLVPKLEANCEKDEAEFAGIQPLPMMTVEEAREFIYRIMTTAHERKLESHECGMLGQLLCSYEIAIRSETLRFKGRWICMSEDGIREIVERT